MHVKGRAQRRNSEASRAAILRAAEAIFAEKGLAGARTDAIARAAHVNKALLYYYFKSKEQIYLAVLDEHRQGYIERATEILSRPGPAAPILLEYVSAHFDFISSHRHYAGLFQRSVMARGGPGDAALQKRVKPLALKLGALLRRGIRNGEFRRFDTLHTGVSLTAIIVFYFAAAPIIQAISGIDPFSEANIRKRKREVMRFIRQAIFVNPDEVSR